MQYGTSQLFFPCVQCFYVSISLDVRSTLLRQMDMGSLTCTYIWVHAIHMKGDQAQTSLHKSWLGGTEKTVPHPALLGVWTKSLWIRIPMLHWATSPTGTQHLNCYKLLTYTPYSWLLQKQNMISKLILTNILYNFCISFILTDFIIESLPVIIRSDAI